MPRRTRSALVASALVFTVRVARWGRPYRSVQRTSARHDPFGRWLTVPWALTMADRKRDTLQRLYRHDSRVAPWAGTAHGVVQATNTYAHHEAIVRGADRAERNMLKTITG